MGAPSAYCHNAWCGKTRTMWLPVGEKSVISLAVSTEYRRVTDGDGRTRLQFNVCALTLCALQIVFTITITHGQSDRHLVTA